MKTVPRSEMSPSELLVGIFIWVKNSAKALFWWWSALWSWGQKTGSCFAAETRVLFIIRLTFLCLIPANLLSRHCDKDNTMETAAASGGSLFFQALALRKRLGITSWIELILIGMTGYLITMYLATWIGLYAPMTSLIAIAGMSFSCYQIHLLGSLSERLEQFVKENKRLEESNKQLSESVSTFKEQNAKLKETTGKLAINVWLFLFFSTSTLSREGDNRGLRERNESWFWRDHW